MTDVFTAQHAIEYPGGYTRSVGPVIGRFLTGLRDGRILAVRLADTRSGVMLAAVTAPVDSLGATIAMRSRHLADSIAARLRGP